MNGTHSDAVLTSPPEGICPLSGVSVSASETALDRYERVRLSLPCLLLPDPSALLKPATPDDHECATRVLRVILAALSPDAEMEKLRAISDELKAMLPEPADLVASGSKAAVYDEHFRVKRVPDNVARTALAISSILATLDVLDNIEEHGSSIDSIVVGELIRGWILALGAIQFEGGAQ